MYQQKASKPQFWVRALRYVVLFKHIMNLNSLSSINLLVLVKEIADKARSYL